MGESDQLEEIGQIARVLLATREGGVFGGQARERSTRYDFEREDGFGRDFCGKTRPIAKTDGDLRIDRTVGAEWEISGDFREEE